MSHDEHTPIPNSIRIDDPLYYKRTMVTKTWCWLDIRVIVSATLFLSCTIAYVYLQLVK